MARQDSELKTMQTRDLRVGMYVQDVGRGWLRHPWPTKSKLITSPQEINQLLELGISEVIIDEARSVTPQEVSEQVTPTGKPSQPSIHQAERRRQVRPETKSDTAQLEDELPRAHRAYLQALETTREFMHDIRLGHKVEVAKVQESIDSMIDSVFRNRDALLTMLKLKNYDEYTFTHSLNVSVLALSIARHLDFDRTLLGEMGLGCMFHDVGKTGIPDNILNKPSRLTDDEFAIMKQHPVIGARMLEEHGRFPEAALAVVRHHHERLDGGGYPDHLSGANLTDVIGISGIADVYDAVSSDRVYHKGMQPHMALKLVFSLRGQHFPPLLVDRFIHCLGIYPAGTTVKLNTGEIGVVFEVNHASLLKPRICLVIDTKSRLLDKKKIIDLSEQQLQDREIIDVVDPALYGIVPEQYFIS